MARVALALFLVFGLLLGGCGDDDGIGVTLNSDTTAGLEGTTTIASQTVVFSAPVGTPAQTLVEVAVVVEARMALVSGEGSFDVLAGDGVVTVSWSGGATAEQVTDVVVAPGIMSMRPVLSVTETPPTGATAEEDPSIETLAIDPRTGEGLRLGPAALTEHDVISAGVRFQGQSPPVASWIVVVEFGTEGSESLADTTAALASYPMGDPRRQLAVILDGTVVAILSMASDVSPTEGFTGGTAVLALGHGEDDTELERLSRHFAAVLNSGPLQIDLEAVGGREGS